VASKNIGKKSLLPSKNRHYISDCANENKYTSRRYTVVFCFGDEIYDDICHYYTDINSNFIMYRKFLWIIARKRLRTAFVYLYTWCLFLRRDCGTKVIAPWAWRRNVWKILLEVLLCLWQMWSDVHIDSVSCAFIGRLWVTDLFCTVIFRHGPLPSYSFTIVCVIHVVAA